MIKTHKLRNFGIRLFCLLAAVLALSQSAAAGSWPGNKYQVQMTGDPVGGWSAGFKDMVEIDENHYQVGFTATSTNDMGFRIKINGVEYGPTDNNTNTILSEGLQEANLVDYSDYALKTGAWLIKPEVGYTYLITFWYQYDGKVQFQLNKGKNCLEGSFNGWKENNAKEFEGSAATLTTSVPCWQNGADGFKFRYASVWYGKTDDASLTNGDAFADFSTSGDNMKLDASAEGKEVTFTLSLEKRVPKSLTATWSEPASKLTAAQLVGIKVKDESLNYDYITYSPEGNGYGVTYDVNATDDAITATQLSLTKDELNAIYGDGTKCEFTDKVLLMSLLPEQFTGESTQYPKSEVGDYTLSKAGTTDTDYQGGKQSDDGSFCAVVTADNITAAAEYEVVLAYKYKPDGSSTLVEGGTTTPGKATVQLTVPEPKLKAAKIELFHGSDNTAATDAETAKFRLDDGTIMTSRYNSLREYVEVEMPNVSTELKGKIDAAAIDANPAFTVKFGEESLTDGVYEGNVMEPDKFKTGTYSFKTVTCTTNLPNTVNYHKRWNDDVTIDGITMNLAAPQNVSFNIESGDVSFAYENGHLIETVNATLKLDGAETENTVVSGTETAVIACDNYLVSFYDDNGGKQAPLVGENAELVVSSTELTAGKKVTLKHDHGTWWDGIDEAVEANRFCDRLRANYVMLYPFLTAAVAPQPASAPAVMKPYKAEGDGVMENVVVLKSAATETRETEDIVTSADQIGADAAVMVSAGAGYIEVRGASADIYAADGMRMASGEGRFSLPAGVYVVKTAASVSKVMVR